ncbi:hypothetical protein RIF29_04218 [Crotalaria pallida]|uniref:Replication factor A C-terminal domain-containing protein n=1 Tax=Crotalaria pallida TaxID=3830 RepID=A0AAN9J0T2_CROPI
MSNVLVDIYLSFNEMQTPVFSISLWLCINFLMDFPASDNAERYGPLFLIHKSALSCLTSKISRKDVDGVVVLLATVNEIVNNGNWWYPSCKCHKAVFTDNGVYYCSACSRHVFNVVSRYKVTIDVSDGTGSAWLIIFDYDVTYLIKKNCSDLLSSFTEATDDLEFPSELKSIVARRMLFKVSNTYSSSDHDTCVFKVRGLCDDPNIIAMYDLEGADNAPLDGIPVACSAPVVDLSLDGENFSEDSNRFASPVVDPYLPHTNDASVMVNSAHDSDSFTTPVMNKRKSEYSLGEVSYNSATGKKKSLKLSKK